MDECGGRPESLTDEERAQARGLAAQWLGINAQQGDLYDYKTDKERAYLRTAGARIYLHRWLAEFDDALYEVKATPVPSGCLLLDREDEARDDLDHHPFALVIGDLDAGYFYAGWRRGSEIVRTDDRRFRSEHGGPLRFAEQHELDSSMETLLAYLRGQAPSDG